MIMMNHSKTYGAKIFLCLIVSFLFTSASFAQKIPARPVPPRLVNDFANILSDRQERVLEQKLVRYNDTTSTQICVVTVNDLGGTTSSDFAYQIGEKWGVGSKENNGAVILVKPKRGNESGDVAIQIGYGLEPYVTDALAKRIINLEMIPEFRENRYYEGIDRACDVIIGLASGAFTADEYNKGADEVGNIAFVFSVLIFFIVIIAILGKGGNKGNNSGNSGRSSGFWEGLFIGSMMGRRSGGSWGGSRGSSGGFGGFGGGSFGGGGASGKW